MFIEETNGKTMVKSWDVSILYNKTSIFGMFFSNPMMKTFQKSRCSQVDVLFRTDLTAVNLPDCLDIELKNPKSVCQPGHEDPKV